jgi:UDP-N-acetylglucosamine 1-carboxyvinyltransferase
MAQYIIEGEQELSGEIKVAGAKNAALKILAAAILLDDKCTITNVPQIEDINRMIELLQDLGANVSFSGSTIEIDTKEINKTTLDTDLTHRLRSSIMLAGPLLARFGKITMVHPGGCIIGQRPIDFYISGFTALGAKLKDEKESYSFKTDKLIGTKIILPRISVTVTESLMMAACKAQGTTTIINAAMEPEIKALANFLNSCGAKITGAGTPEMTIEGVESLTGGTYNIIPDRLETGSFVVMGLITGSEIKITNCNPNHLQTELLMLEKAGAKLEIGKDYIITKKSKIKATSITTHEYPGFATDLQPLFTVLMTQAEGQTLIHEAVYEGRLFYTDKLNIMGANITMCDPHRVIVNGPTRLYGRTLEGPDLRAGMALVLAGLVAEGQTIIGNVYQIERGYENLTERLTKLGVKITRQD